MIDQIKKEIIETPPTDDKDVVYNKLTPGDLVLQVNTQCQSCGSTDLVLIKTV